MRRRTSANPQEDFVCALSSPSNRLRAISFCQRPYSVEHTRSHLNSEVKQPKARSVLGWGTAWEVLRVLLAFSHHITPYHTISHHTTLPTFLQHQITPHHTISRRSHRTTPYHGSEWHTTSNLYQISGRCEIYHTKSHVLTTFHPPQLPHKSNYKKINQPTTNLFEIKR